MQGFLFESNVNFMWSFRDRGALALTSMDMAVIDDEATPRVTIQPAFFAELFTLHQLLFSDSSSIHDAGTSIFDKASGRFPDLGMMRRLIRHQSIISSESESDVFMRSRDLGTEPENPWIARPELGICNQNTPRGRSR
jgi:hypothetical protein